MLLIERLTSYTVKVETPDGTMYVLFDEEDDNTLVSIRVIIGKAGTAIRAWTETVSELLTIAIRCGASLDDIVSRISQQTSGNIAYNRNIPIRSGPEGVSYSIMKYRWDRNTRLAKPHYEVTERRNRRPARLHNVDR